MKNFILPILLVFIFSACEKEKGPEDTTDITKHFEKTFALLLEERGYISDAKKITWADVKEIKKVDVSVYNEQNGKLVSLSGIEYFAALDTLDCGYSQISSLNVSKNKKLTYLSCHSNRFTNLDVSENAALIYLDCSWNQLASLDVSKNAALIYLNCSYNRLTSLDISNNTSLSEFWCRDYEESSGGYFPVTAWFDNNNIPDYFETAWIVNSTTYRVDYQKADKTN